VVPTQCTPSSRVITDRALRSAVADLGPEPSPALLAVRSSMNVIEPRWKGGPAGTVMEIGPLVTVWFPG
jgi:hypothetical protein